MQKGLVSVIIPTFNRSSLVIAAIESALNQTYQQVEVLIIDDGSNDDTKEKIKQLSDYRLKYYFQFNAGVASARNHGFRVAQGEFIAFLDSDDRWYPEKLELELLALQAFPDAKMVWTEMSAIDVQGNILHEKYLRKMYQTYRFFSQPEALFSSSRFLKNLNPTIFPNLSPFITFWVGNIFSGMSLGNLVHTSTVLIRAQAQKEVGFFNELYRTGEDYPFHLKMSSLGPAVFIDAPLILYRIGSEDALTSPENLLEISQNFLSTIESNFQNHSHKIQLPRKLIRKGLSEAHLWVAEQLLQKGKNFQAIQHTIKSFFIYPSLRITFKLTIKCLTPKKILHFCRKKNKK